MSIKSIAAGQEKSNVIKRIANHDAVFASVLQPIIKHFIKTYCEL